MNILHIVRQFAPAIGGLESYVRDLCYYQQQLGHQADVLTLNQLFHGMSHGALPAHEVIEGTTIHRIGYVGHRRYFLPFLRPSFLRRYDVLHVHNTDMFYDTLALLKSLVRRPLVATTHGGFFHTGTLGTLKRCYFHSITRMASKAYAHLFAISQNDYDTFATICPATQLSLQPNAIRPISDQIAAGEDFIYIGRIAQHKHVERLIDTFALLKQQHHVSGRLHIVGPAWDVSLEALQARIDSHHISEHVVLHGAVNQDQLAPIAHQCRYFLSASTFEGFGMSMIEAMSVGLIPFVQPNASFTELVTDACVGWCVDYSDAQHAASFIAANIATVTEEKRTEAQKFSQLYAWDILAKNSVAAYERAMGA
ncbi:MAG: glycosyltransferase family 4 protein [Sphaerospermopsis sp. SIO1G2]|nr:glycosyltransferase family 4 protein [Sphaerospermopsis sp. SIO1G2]